jgi:fibronectin-binding autotransporter adhesin
MNGDGSADIVTALGRGGAPLVKVFSGQDGSLLSSFLAFPRSFTGGLNVAVVDDWNGDGSRPSRVVRQTPVP